MKFVCWIALFSSSCLLFLPPSPVLASGMFVVRPAKIELALPPGGERTAVIIVANETSDPVDVAVSFEDVEAKLQRDALDEPFRLLGTGHGTHSLKDFFSTPQSSFGLLPGGTIELPITLRIPPDMEPGGRYGSAVIHFRSASGTTAANVALESRVAVTFFARIEGDVLERGKLVAFGLFNDAQFVVRPTERKPLRFHLAYENEGTVHLNPYGRLTLTPFFGAPHVVFIDPWVVLPSATRMRQIDIMDTLPIGPYHAHLELNRGYNDVVDEASVDFWILPGLWGSVGIVVALALLVIFFRRSLQLSKHFIR